MCAHAREGRQAVQFPNVGMGFVLRAGRGFARAGPLGAMWAGTGRRRRAAYPLPHPLGAAVGTPLNIFSVFGRFERVLSLSATWVAGMCLTGL